MLGNKTQRMPNKRTAVNDIQVYKILKERKTRIFNRIKYVSPYYKFKYKLNKVYQSELELDSQTLDGVLMIEKGLHSFINLQHAEYYRAVGGPCCETWIIFKAIIPKGSTYYINEIGEIVSNKLKIVEICG